MLHFMLQDREDGQPVSGVRRIVRVPGGNPNLPVAAVLESPRRGDFWDEEMPAYVLSIIDETVTNGWKLGSDHELILLSDGTELAKTRLRYAVKALEAQGAIQTWPGPTGTLM